MLEVCFQLQWDLVCDGNCVVTHVILTLYSNSSFTIFNIENCMNTTTPTPNLCSTKRFSARILGWEDVSSITTQVVFGK